MILITRRMQNLNFSVMLFWYGFVAMVITTVIICSESLINSASIRFLSYSGVQYGWMILITVSNFVAISV